MTVERDWFWFWFWFYYALWLASVFTLVLVLRQSSENRSKTKRHQPCSHYPQQHQRHSLENKTRKPFTQHNKELKQPRRRWQKQRRKRQLDLIRKASTVRLLYIRELKQQRFRATHVNRKWPFFIF